jgi:hypothetical protein
LWPTYSQLDYIGDNEAMLFNLSCNRYFPSKQTGKDIWWSRIWGPSFRGESGAAELSAVNEPFNGENNCSSCAN